MDSLSLDKFDPASLLQDWRDMSDLFNDLDRELELGNIDLSNPASSVYDQLLQQHAAGSSALVHTGKDPLMSSSGETIHVKDEFPFNEDEWPTCPSEGFRGSDAMEVDEMKPYPLEMINPNDSLKDLFSSSISGTGAGTPANASAVPGAAKPAKVTRKSLSGSRTRRKPDMSIVREDISDTSVTHTPLAVTPSHPKPPTPKVPKEPKREIESPQQQQQLEGKRRNRKYNREAVLQNERLRRERTNNAVHLLKKIIPGIHEKSDKASVLESAAYYVLFLKKRIGSYLDDEFKTHNM